MFKAKTLCVALMAVSSMGTWAYGKENKDSYKPEDTEESAEAPSKSRKSSYEPPYGMAGCGFWSTVIKGQTRDAQLGVSVLRFLPYLGSIDSQTSGITSGTSNCVKGRAEIEEAEQITFVTVNLASLTKEAAQGSGQHLASLAEIFGCPEGAFAQFSQDHYGTIYDSEKADDVLRNYLREVRSDASLAGTCQRVG